MDGSYHTPEWHAARLAGLQTTHTITWEEYKKKQKVLLSYLLHVKIKQWLATLIMFSLQSSHPQTLMYC